MLIFLLGSSMMMNNSKYKLKRKSQGKNPFVEKTLEEARNEHKSSRRTRYKQFDEENFLEQQEERKAKHVRNLDSNVAEKKNYIEELRALRKELEDQVAEQMNNEEQEEEKHVFEFPELDSYKIPTMMQEQTTKMATTFKTNLATHFFKVNLLNFMDLILI